MEHLGATPQETAEKEAVKLCNKLGLNADACKVIVACIKAGELRACINAGVMAAAGGTCAAYTGSKTVASICAGVAAWLVSKVGTTGYITAPGCQVAPRTYINTPEPIVEKTQRRLGGKNIQHWDIRWRTQADFDALVAKMSPGEYAQVWSQAQPTEDGGSSRVSITPMFYVGCGEGVAEATYGLDTMRLRLAGGYGSPALARAAANRWTSPNILAVRDWDGQVYRVSNYNAPYWFSPALRVAVDPAPDAFKLVPTIGKGFIAVGKLTAFAYPPGTVAVFDSSINKYRIIAPV